MSLSCLHGRRVRRRSAVILGSALALATAVTALVPAAGFAGSTPPPVGKVVISEFRVAGPDPDGSGTATGAANEFVELRNVSAAPVDISGYKLQGCSSGGGTPSDRATVPASTTLAPGQAYLFTNSASGGYNGTVPGDTTYTTGFSDFTATTASGIRIIDATGGVKDGVGSAGSGTGGATSQCREGAGLTSPGTNGQDQSFERKPTAEGPTRNSQDTNDNPADFDGPKAGAPENRSSTPVEPEPENRTGLVISEFRFRGPAGGNDEFVEVRNTSTQPIDITNLGLEGCNSNGPSGVRARVNGSFTLAPQESFLFANTTPTTGFSGTQEPDVGFTTGISDTGGARIITGDEASPSVVDAAGSTETTAACREGAGLTIPITNGDNSFERKSTTPNRNGQDTNDNPDDFTGPKAGNPEPNPREVGTTKISQIQGMDDCSPFVAQDSCDSGGVSDRSEQEVTIQGVVTGKDDEVGQSSSGRQFENERGIFVQEEVADEDANPSTSEGIFVGFVRGTADPDGAGPQRSSLDNIPNGAIVRVTGNVRELFGFTIIEEKIGQEPQIITPESPPGTARTVAINDGQAESQPLCDDSQPGGGGMGGDPGGGNNERSENEQGCREYYETLESMKVSAQQSAARSGGTNKFDELFLTPTMGAADPEARDRIFRNEPARDLLGTDEDAGSDNPANTDNPSNNKSTTVVNADIFDTVSDLEGPFAFNFGNYKVMVQDSADETGEGAVETDGEPTVQDTGSPYPYGARPQSPAAEFPGLRPFTPRQVRVMSYNINNFFDNKDDPNKDDEFDETTDREPEKQQRAVDVINDVLKRPDVIALQEVENQGVVDRLAAAAGGYRAFHEEGNDNRSIDNAFLVKNSVQVSNVRQLGKGEEEPESIPADQDCSDRRGLLFDRPPLAADIRTRNGQTFTVFGNHFAAKGGGTEAEEGGRSECRQAQARFVAQQVRAVTGRGGQSIVTGDLNSFENEKPLQVLEREGQLDNQFDREVAKQRYSFLFNGRLQTLDHILVTGGLNRRFAAFQYAHFNVDYFERELQQGQMARDGEKLSVHEPPILTLNDPAAPVSPPPPPPGGGNGGGGNGGAPGRRINGTSGDDVLVGTAGNDVINCGSGNDRADGGGGNDIINCGSGNDVVNGGAGNDRIHGDSGNDRLGGGPGNDTVFGDGGDDRINGGPGSDRLSGGTGRNSVFQD
jgi:predicted extracellular nuclease